ncbi:V-set and immunoglobulin domain-containing protein 4 isoform X2 [Bufo bufo]|uniref:V-set and immunoglobulin domain-containing protein 4 isoform X2 n=1 Tax=Bufo bufo TaxID=8384 RepID=UPI001ABE9CE2|nr:V-set and immunoglobulin domain-containing protein 4 isoform X2 [Bufo bufo]
MEDDLVMGHIKWLLMFVICFSGRNANCDLSINMKKIVTGVRGLSVDIPCTYTPSKDYEVVEVEWVLDHKVIIHRIESQDHIPLVEFRKRVEISKSAGDVSLSISKLTLGDKGDVKCKVTWKKNDGAKISKEEITKLKILRTIPITKKHDATISSEVTSIPHFGTVSTMEITKLTTNMKVRKGTIVTPLYTTELFNTNATKKKGFGIPLYMLVVIIICVLCIMTLALVLIIKKKKKNIYNLPTMNQLLALEGAGNGCQSCTNEMTASNVYESSNPPPVSVYEGIVLPFSNEYDLLITERIPENDSS